MNIRTDKAGAVTGKYFLSKGFKIDNETDVRDGERGGWTLTDYSKGNIHISGGYWTWYVKDKNGKSLGEYWWNTEEEFDKTLKQLENEI